MTRPSRYEPAAAPDYRHRFHAGNVGDVWKHCALVEVLRRVAGRSARPVYVESHAGAGSYALGPTGEWTEGIGRLWNGEPADDAVARYVALCRRLGDGVERPARYPGSPLFARAVLGPNATLRLWERDPPTCEALAAALEGPGAARAATTVTCADGMDVLGQTIRDAESASETVVALIDPPWTAKADWTAVPDAVARLAAASGRATIILWYPVKSLTRPNAMVLRLRGAGVGGTLAELVTTPLDYQRRRLNGSGLLLIRPPAGTLEAIGAAAPVLGARCATVAGFWSTRMVSWSPRGRSARPDQVVAEDHPEDQQQPDRGAEEVENHVADTSRLVP